MKSGVGVSFTTLALAFVLAASACTEEDIVLATVPVASGSGEGAGVPGTRCVTSSECGAGAFCDRRHCGEPAGTCEPFPVSCVDEERPVCGCDGITYFNDCLRRVAGVAGSDPEECGGRGVACGKPQTSCPEGSVCARFGGGPPKELCHPPPDGGRCWVLPSTCPVGGRPDRWDECGEGPGLRCVNTCSAIRSGKPFRRALECH